MKRFFKSNLCLLLLFSIIVSLFGCGGAGSSSSNEIEDLIKGSDIEISEKDNYLTIVYTQTTTPNDYSDIVSTGLTDFVNVGKVYFDKYETIRMDMQLADTSGEVSVVTSLICSKDSFNSISWDDIKYAPGSYDDFVGKFDKFYVESVIMKDVDTQKIYYKGTNL